MFGGDSKSAGTEESNETEEKTKEDSDDLYVQLATPLAERKGKFLSFLLINH